jgi:hypothetical protein
MDHSIHAESLTYFPQYALSCSTARPWPWVSRASLQLDGSRATLSAGWNRDGQSGACCSMTSKVRDNPDRSRFELDLGGQVVFARYARQGSTLVIPLRGGPAFSARHRRGKPGHGRGDGDCPDGGTEGQAALQLCLGLDAPTPGVPRPAWLIVSGFHASRPEMLRASK